MIATLLTKKSLGLAWDKIKAAPPWVWYLLGLALAAFALDCYVDAQVAAERQRVTDQYERKINHINNVHDASLAANLQRNREILGDIKGKLAVAQQVKVVKETVIKEVPKYVSPKADAACVIPAGFVQLHNQTAATGTATVSRSGPADADAPTAVTLSTVAEVTASNNAECVYRGELLERWAEWYPAVKASYEQYRASIQHAYGRK